MPTYAKSKQGCRDQQSIQSSTKIPINGSKIHLICFKRHSKQLKLSKWLESSWNHFLLLAMMSYLQIRPRGYKA